MQMANGITLSDNRDYTVPENTAFGSVAKGWPTYLRWPLAAGPRFYFLARLAPSRVKCVGCMYNLSLDSNSSVNL